jgi:GNAT superfamily N-acetyltransferase
MIRPAEPKDREAILEITRRAWAGRCVAFLLEERHGTIGGKPWHDHKCGEVRAMCEADWSHVFVYEEDGRVVGYAGWGYYPERRVGEVENNAVDPDFQGRGIATALIARVVEELRRQGARVLIVHALAGNHAARRVYEKMGFELLVDSVMYSMDA